MKLEEIGFGTLCDDRAKNVSPTSPLWRASLLITSRCNFRCPYCNGLSCGGDVDHDWLFYIMGKMANDGLKSVRFSGGEPTLHPWLMNFVAAAKAYGIYEIGCSTNGSADWDYYKRMVKHGCNEFAISCDTNDPVIGRELLGGIDGQWEKVISNIRKLSKISKVFLGLTVGKSNLNDIPEILEFCDSLGVADIKLSTATSYNGEIPRLDEIPQKILDRHAVLRYRVRNFMAGRNVRGLQACDCRKCPLVMDDIIVMGVKHYPCNVYAREGGAPIGEMTEDIRAIREQRAEWGLSKDTHVDPICSVNCMDIFSCSNSRMMELSGYLKDRFPRG